MKEYTDKMKFTILIVLCLMRGLAQDCENDGNGTLSNCLSNPNIRVEKILKLGGIKSYKLSLYYQNTWWPTEKNDKWIECKHLCDVCKSLPGIGDVNNVCSGNQCEQKVDMFINGFCASATPITHISIVTDTQTITSTSSFTETITSTSHLSVFITSTSHLTVTVTSVMPTTVERFITRTTTETQRRTTTSTTTEREKLPVCNPARESNEDYIVDPPYKHTQCDPEITKIEVTQQTQRDASKPTVNSKTSMKSNTQLAPTIALGILAGLFFIVLAAVISGWVWTCWTIKTKREDTSNNMVETSETKGCSFDLELSNNPAYETMVQDHSSIRNPVKLTVAMDINPAYEATKTKPRQQLQDESEPNYEVIASISNRDNKAHTNKLIKVKN